MKTTEPPTNSETKLNFDLSRIAELIKGIEIAMLTTVDANGRLLSRPMAAQDEDFTGRLWFFTRVDSGKVHDIEADQHVNVAFADAKAHRYISLTGVAHTVHDRAKMKELWRPHFKTWFPEGLEDQNLALLAVDVESAEIWGSLGQAAEVLKLAAAAFVGKKELRRPEQDRIEIPKL